MKASDVERAQAVAFFYDHGPFTQHFGESEHDGRMRCAIELEAAEVRVADGPFFATCVRDEWPVVDHEDYDPAEWWVVRLWQVPDGGYHPVLLGSQGSLFCSGPGSPEVRAAVAELAVKHLGVNT